MYFLLGFPATHNSVIVMDNASFHKQDDARQLIEQAGHSLEFLPPYSPDLKPIEHKQKLSEERKSVPLMSCFLSSFESFYCALAIVAAVTIKRRPAT